MVENNVSLEFLRSWKLVKKQLPFWKQFICILSDFFSLIFHPWYESIFMHCFYFWGSFNNEYLYLSILRNFHVLSHSISFLFFLNSCYKMNLLDLSSRILIFSLLFIKKYSYLLYYFLGTPLNLYSKTYT